MEHRIKSSRRQGEKWHLKCSCGWFITADRYICEEAHKDHAAPEPTLPKRRVPLHNGQNLCLICDPNPDGSDCKPQCRYMPAIT